MSRVAIVLTALGLALAGAAVYFFARQREQTLVVTLQPGPPQPRVSLGEAGLDPQAIEAAVTYAAARNTRALVVGRGGHIVLEKYWDGTTSDTAVDPGFAPVLAALAVGSALNDRLIMSLDAPLSDYLPNGGGTQGSITLRQLLAQDPAGMSVGESTDYLAFVLERVTSQKYPTLLAERLWKPMEAGSIEYRVADNRLRPGGVSAGCCVRARIGDWMRIAELLANDGIFEGNQFTPPRYVHLMLRPAHKDSPRGYFTRVDGAFATEDVARLEGSDKQRLWIVPSLRLTILRIGGEPSQSQGWDEAMIPDSIIRGTSGWQPRPVGEGVDPKKFAPH
jgi:CubicO group peptidase (beta-lactamase class C family)